MSNVTTIELASYPDRFQAETIRLRLAAAGIPSQIFGTDAASAFGMGGAPQTLSVRIEVADDDLNRAKQILDQDRKDAIDRGPWPCEHCGETNEATFDLCWKCNGPQVPETQQNEPKSPAEFESVAVEDVSLRPKLPADNPYRPVLIPDAAHTTGRPEFASKDHVDAPVDPQLRADVRRALHAAVVGWLALPPLMSIYSIYRLLRLQEKIPANRSLRRRVMIAWFCNVVAILLWPAFWLQVASSIVFG